MIETLLKLLLFASLIFPSVGFCEITENDLTEQKSCGDYKIKIYRNKPGDGLLKIIKGDREAYSEEGIKFRLGLINEDIPEDKLVIGCKDITGSGEPNIVVSQWSGGMHCCFSFQVFSLGKVFKKIGDIDSADNASGKFSDVDNDGILEFSGTDGTFAYWNSSFSNSPAPEIILKYKEGKYKLAMDLMKKDMPAPFTEKKIIDEANQERVNLGFDLTVAKFNDKTVADPMNYGWYKKGVLITPKIWGHMLNLIYTGNAKEAIKFLLKVWPENTKEDSSLLINDFFAEFMDKLGESPYCSDLSGYYKTDFLIGCVNDDGDYGNGRLKEISRRKFFKDMFNESKLMVEPK